MTRRSHFNVALGAVVLSIGWIAAPAAQASVTTLNVVGSVHVAAARESQPALSNWDIQDLKRHAKYLVEDVVTADEYTADGIQAELALAELGRTFDRLLGDAVPPGTSPSKYMARLQTLSDFAWDAADAYEYGDDMTGLAKYTVIRENIPPILNAINRALHTHYRLPAL